MCVGGWIRRRSPGCHSAPSPPPPPVMVRRGLFGTLSGSTMCSTGATALCRAVAVGADAEDPDLESVISVSRPAARCNSAEGGGGGASSLFPRPPPL